MPKDGEQVETYLTRVRRRFRNADVRSNLAERDVSVGRPRPRAGQEDEVAGPHGIDVARGRRRDGRQLETEVAQALLGRHEPYIPIAW